MSKGTHTNTHTHTHTYTHKDNNTRIFFVAFFDCIFFSFIFGFCLSIIFSPSTPSLSFHFIVSYFLFCSALLLFQFWSTSPNLFLIHFPLIFSTNWFSFHFFRAKVRAEEEMQAELQREIEGQSNYDFSKK